jgi:hypothetical protein
MCVGLKPKVNYIEIAELEEERLSFPRQTSRAIRAATLPTPRNAQKRRPQSLNLQD